MATATPLPQTEGRLIDNLVHFARALRRAGVKAGPAQVEDAVRAVRAVGFASRADLQAALRAVLVNRPQDLALFDQMFALFWRDPDYLGRMIHMLSPSVKKDDEDKPRKKVGERRAAEALAEAPPAPSGGAERQELEIDAQFSWSASETLRTMDFEQMSVEESASAARLMRTLTLPVPPVPTRRRRRAAHGRTIDTRATLRASFRKGGEIARLVRAVPDSRPPDLVVLCDISGSMTAYARMMMHFLHALAWAPRGSARRGWGQVHAFTFGTRLTAITRALHKRDVDAALDAIAQEARDWQGGTRIGDALERFNRDWSRRVLSRGAVVLLISDGLERGDPAHLGRQAERLALSCRRLVWLNPLLRYDGFAPEAGGIRALLPHVDGLHACHSLNSLEQLAAVFRTGHGAAAA